MLLKVFLFILVAYFIFKKITSLLLWLMGRNPGNNGYRPSQPRKEGEIRIDYVPGKSKKPKKDYTGGEYIDYEEVE